MRSVTSTIQSAIDNPVSYKPVVKLEFAVSRFFRSSFDSSFPVSGADIQGLLDDPIKQEIEYCPDALGLATFWCDGSLKYALQGDSSVTTTSYSSSAKPGTLGTTMFLFVSGDIVRYSIDWAAVAARNVNPLTQQASVTPSLAVHALHAVGATECIAIAEDNGGYRAIYVSGTNQYLSTSRFMFPKTVDWDGSSRTMASMAVFSAGLKIGNKVFAYISNAATGIVHGIEYDIDTGSWSEVFVAMPTDLQTSLCEIRLTNGYTRNGTGYLCGQFSRRDAYEGSKVYTLLMYSQNGRYYSIDRFSLVSDTGYRLLARVGSDNNLYIGGSNRNCFGPVTWVFDGSGNTYQKLELDMNSIISVSDSSSERLKIELKSGNEILTDNPHVATGSRVRLYTGYLTGIGNEFVLHGTYIVDQKDTNFSDGGRNLVLGCLNESQWKLSGLTMPFYVEISGKSSQYDPLNTRSGKLFTASEGARTVTKFSVDFWNHIAYSNSPLGISGITMYDSGGVSYKAFSAAHKAGIITRGDLKDIVGLKSNPRITSTSITIDIHGWSRPLNTGQPNDQIDVVLVLTDENGENEQTIITDEGKHWKITYPYTASGDEPISIVVSGLSAGMLIKKVGIVMWNSSVGSWTNIARVDFVNNVEAYIPFKDANEPWKVNDNGSFGIPGPGRPYIMFTQKPYNAFNFIQSAVFENTVTSPIAGYPVGSGLIGLAENALNYILARYNVTDSRAELVKVRNGVETVLAFGSPGWSLGTKHGIQFAHKDGTFTVSMLNEATGAYEFVFSYAWQASDGFMYTSKTAAMKCGIYGAIISPFARTLGLLLSQTETTSNADGIGFEPLADLAAFPSTGQIRIDDTVYSYTGKVDHPSPARGPYQFRQRNTYSPPFGNGTGLEDYDLDWNASASLLTGKLIALDSGACFIVRDSLWQVFDRTGGVYQYHPNRSRHYSNNSQIGVLYHYLNNRVWVVGGLTGLSVSSGEPVRHSVGSIAMLYLEGTISCLYYMGSGGQDDTTIADLLEMVAGFSGARMLFPNDHTQASLSVSGTTTVFQDYFADGFDMRFGVSGPQDFSILTNVKLKPDNYEEKALIVSDTGTRIQIDHLSGTEYQLRFLSTPSDTEMFSMKYTNTAGAQKYRLIYHEKNISFYQNGKWVVTIAADELIYNQTDHVLIQASGTFTMTDIIIRELGDWREAVYIDMETDGRSAISSIIQERPVDNSSNSDGSLSMWYTLVLDTITKTFPPERHNITDSIPTDGASDAIIYSAKDARTLQYSDFAQSLGLATRLVRVPSLNVGSTKAARNMLSKAHQRRRIHRLVLRPDISITVGDVLALNYNTSGTGRSMIYSVVVESVDYNLSMTGEKMRSNMSISGRDL